MLVHCFISLGHSFFSFRNTYSVQLQHYEASDTYNACWFILVFPATWVNRTLTWITGSLRARSMWSFYMRIHTDSDSDQVITTFRLNQKLLRLQSYIHFLHSESDGDSISASISLDGNPGLKIRLRIALSRPEISPVLLVLSGLAIFRSKNKSRVSWKQTSWMN